MAKANPRGNPNPSPSTRFGGPRGPAPGKTAETKRMEIENAERAMRIRQRILNAAEAKLTELSTDEVLAQYVEAAMLKLLKDSEDRGLGAPVQSHTSPDGSMSPNRIVIEAASANRDDTVTG